jgi:hypothetical protein
MEGSLFYRFSQASDSTMFLPALAIFKAKPIAPLISSGKC